MWNPGGGQGSEQLCETLEPWCEPDVWGRVAVAAGEAWWFQMPSNVSQLLLREVEVSPLQMRLGLFFRLWIRHGAGKVQPIRDEHKERQCEGHSVQGRLQEIRGRKHLSHLTGRHGPEPICLPRGGLSDDITQVQVQEPVKRLSWSRPLHLYMDVNKLHRRDSAVRFPVLRDMWTELRPSDPVSLSDLISKRFEDQLLDMKLLEWLSLPQILAPYDRKPSSNVKRVLYEKEKKEGKDGARGCCSHLTGLSTSASLFLSLSLRRFSSPQGSEEAFKATLEPSGDEVLTVIKTKAQWPAWQPLNMRAAPSAEFSVDRSRHLMSFLTMLGPSPDWNVGLSGEDLCTKECGWVQRLETELIPWDAALTEESHTRLLQSPPSSSWLFLTPPDSSRLLQTPPDTSRHLQPPPDSS
ncbi:unnamed protein product [Pleuronectes platessa]|uniref:Spondin domain-containing protein n=1 Tax=Pleuronectes platessa TaxID=8262 RepID=A0A9N7YI88_PLEPL|nr:unnamed protein product [Pleuronectes platessa]